MTFCNICFADAFISVAEAPELKHLLRSRHRIPPECKLKIQARLLYSKEILFRSKIDELDKQIKELKDYITACSNDLLDLAHEWEKLQEKQDRLEKLKRQQEDMMRHGSNSGVHPSNLSRPLELAHPPVVPSADRERKASRVTRISLGASSPDNSDGDSPVKGIQMSASQTEGARDIDSAPGNAAMEQIDTGHAKALDYANHEQKIDQFVQRPDLVSKHAGDQVHGGNPVVLASSFNVDAVDASAADSVLNLQQIAEGYTAEPAITSSEAAVARSEGPDVTKPMQRNSAPNMSIFKGAGGGRVSVGLSSYLITLLC
jgi:hypothetical protein